MSLVRHHGLMENDIILTVQGLTDDLVVTRYHRRSWLAAFYENQDYDFTSGDAGKPLTDEDWEREGLGKQDHADSGVLDAVKTFVGAAKDGDLGPKIGWSWHLRRQPSGGWSVVGKRRPGSVGKRVSTSKAKAGE